MVSAITSALSGLAASSQRLNVSTENIANSFSAQTQQGGVSTNTPYKAQRVVQSSDPDGSVHANEQDANPPTISRYDPSNAAADASGITAYPNVAQANELVQAQVASYDAQGNISVLKVQSRLLKSVLDIIS